MIVEQIILIAEYIGLLLVNALMILKAASNSRAGAKVLGDKNDNTAATEIANAQLGQDENLLYCCRQRSGKVNGIILLILSGFFFLMVFSLLQVEIQPVEIQPNDLLSFSLILILNLGLATFFTWLACREIFIVQNIFYFITNKRLCVRTVTANGTKEQDVLFENIKKIKAVTSPRSIRRTRRIRTVAFHVIINGLKGVVLKPNGSLRTLAEILTQATGLQVDTYWIKE